MSSAAHQFGHMHFDDVNLRGGSYSPWKAYGQVCQHDWLHDKQRQTHTCCMACCMQWLAARVPWLACCRSAYYNDRLNNGPACVQSKLANVLYTYELDRRLKREDNCTANTLHPGVVGTNLWR